MTSNMIVRLAKLDEGLRVARAAGDIPRMQQLIGQHQRLLESVCGAPLAR
jgi:tetrahydromethanopterin S-methyltransferase subunit F